MHRGKRNSRSGLSLLEVMIVLAIMALVVGIAAPRIVGSFGRAKSQTAQVQMANIRAAVQLFYLDVGRYPSEAEGLEALLNVPQGTVNWRGPYLEKESGVIDPWGRRFEMHLDGAGFAITSYGRDGQPGGEGEDADLVQ